MTIERLARELAQLHALSQDGIDESRGRCAFCGEPFYFGETYMVYEGDPDMHSECQAQYYRDLWLKEKAKREATRQ